jgi:hypothetical protein
MVDLFAGAPIVYRHHGIRRLAARTHPPTLFSCKVLFVNSVSRSTIEPDCWIDISSDTFDDMTARHRIAYVTVHANFDTHKKHGSLWVSI